MSSKDKILSRLKAGRPPAGLPQSTADDKKLFCDYPDDDTDLLARFIAQQQELKGEVYVCSSVSQMADRLKAIFEPIPAKSCLTHSADIIEEVVRTKSELHDYIAGDSDLTVNSPEFARFAAGLSSAAYLIARTGSILINSLQHGGRRLSVLPPLHIVLARENQIVPSLQDVFTQLSKEKNDWSYATLITGPSRTSDIEKKLVLGAHGPKRLVCLILKDQY